MPKLTFLGAAGNVTGSRYLFEDSNIQIMVDCGLYQEREFLSRNWHPSPLTPDKIDAIFLTHAHLDHCGLLPKIVHDGFRGPIYATDATLEMVEVMLLDSARIQEEDADAKKRRHHREGRRGPYPEEPLYTVEDAEACLRLFRPVELGRKVQLDGVTASLTDAGHVMGSAMVFLEFMSNGQHRSIWFSGDIGRPERPLENPPGLASNPDYLVMESTYGDRDHPPMEEVEERLVRTINETVKRGGNIVIPAFALERTQEIIYYLKVLRSQNRIPKLPVFVDSPMAIKLTGIFSRHPELWGGDIEGYKKGSPFEFPGLKLTSSVNESRAIAKQKGSCIIIAGSGMATGGRIKHHLVNNISRAESTILFVGYQARGTLGRVIVSGTTPVRILGKYYEVKARIEQLHGLSAHADRTELLDWATGFPQPPRQVFITHGEEDAAKIFAEALRQRTGWLVTVPQYQDSFEL
ncbi:metallo-beta-lactamase family protein RNA-specific [Dehalogenimonas sp. WBC-2]|nr:metallo-beta-lactamase family protein RNA-specific [Dehalogenimonas sp. WBC-2]